MKIGALFFLVLSLTPSCYAIKKIAIPDSARACAKDSDCITVDIDCNYCCGRDAIHKSFKPQLGTWRLQSCKDSKGPVCDCMPTPATPRCVDKKCRLVSNSPVDA